jgi:hypothetical protein
MILRTFSDGLLSAADRFSERLGPLATVIDALVDRIAPKITAQAGIACGGPRCTSMCCANCSGDAKHLQVQYYGNRCQYYYVVDCTNLC